MQLSLGQLVKPSVDSTEFLSQTLLRYVNESAKWQARVIADNSTFSQHLEQTVTKDFLNNLRSRLKYTELEHRYERINRAELQTYEWIFNPPQQSQNWASFVEFLHGDQNLYWITGKQELEYQH
jgi:hypothetical protein